MTDAMLDARTQRRLQLRTYGYMPIPLYGKVPPLKEWQKLTVISADMVRLWSKVWPDAVNTGVLTRYTPALDIDLMHEPAAVAVEDLSAALRGTRMVLGAHRPAAERAILFHTHVPFGKITVNLTAPTAARKNSSFYATASNSSSTASIPKPENLSLVRR